MEAIEKPKAKHGNPFSRDPVFSEYTGKPKRVAVRKLTATQLQTIALSHEFLVSNPYIAALTGCTVSMAQRRTRELKRPPNDYIAIYDVRRESYVTGNIACFQYFTTTEWGHQTLINRGYCDTCQGVHTGDLHEAILPFRFPRSTSLDHDVFAHNGVMSLEIGAKKYPAISIVRPTELHDQLPAKTKAMEHWWNYPLVARGEKIHVAPDYFPLGIDRNPLEEPIFLAFEFERDQRGRNKQSQIHKVLDWRDVLTHRTYETHMGLPNLYPTFIMRDITAKQRILAHIKEHVPPSLQRFFLVKSEPIDRPELPTGWMLETNFETATGTFNLLSGTLKTGTLT